jgi:cell division protein FtsB
MEAAPKTAINELPHQPMPKSPEHRQNRKIIPIILLLIVLGSTFGTLSYFYLELNNKYDRLQIDDEKLQSDYTQLSADYVDLDNKHNLLQLEYDTLQGNYTQLQLDYARLQGNYTQLTVDYWNWVRARGDLRFFGANGTANAQDIRPPEAKRWIILAGTYSATTDGTSVTRTLILDWSNGSGQLTAIVYLQMSSYDSDKVYLHDATSENAYSVSYSNLKGVELDYDHYLRFWLVNKQAGDNCMINLLVKEVDDA